MFPYTAQIEHYTSYISSNPEWELAGIFADEGISATNTKKRDGFNRMVADALAGKLDLIVTKSVSRFARNTVDSLSTVRRLKEKGVEVYFEKENIYTFDGKGELLITIMSSLAQEESRSISENVTWGQRKRFADGKVSMPYKRFLGYEKGEDGLPKIVEKEADIVRMIYSMFMEGKTTSNIARNLTDNGIPTPGGKKKWQVATVNSILTNEKYKGDALLQKRFTVDFLSKTTKENEGEVPQYYVQDSHPAIIEPEDFDAVQFEIERRKKLGRPMVCRTALSAKLVCGECGGFYGSKVWGSNTKYRKEVWICNDKYKGAEKCNNTHVSEEEVIANAKLAQKMLGDFSKIDEEIEQLNQEINEIAKLSRMAINQNAKVAINQDQWSYQHQKYLERNKKASEKILELEKVKRERANRNYFLKKYIDDLQSVEGLLQEFDENIWQSVVEKVVVMEDGELEFWFKYGENIIIENEIKSI